MKNVYKIYAKYSGTLKKYVVVKLPAPLLRTESKMYFIRFQLNEHRIHVYIINFI